MFCELYFSFRCMAKTCSCKIIKGYSCKNSKWLALRKRKICSLIEYDQGLWLCNGYFLLPEHIFDKVNDWMRKHVGFFSVLIWNAWYLCNVITKQYTLVAGISNWLKLVTSLIYCIPFNNKYDLKNPDEDSWESKCWFK